MVGLSDPSIKRKMMQRMEIGNFYLVADRSINAHVPQLAIANERPHRNGRNPEQKRAKLREEPIQRGDVVTVREA